MAMNREQKRMLQKQGEVDADGQPVRQSRGKAQQAVKPQGRTSPRQFVHEVRAELRKVAWPTRAETRNYSIIVLISLVVMTAFIFGIDWVFSELVLRLFNAK